MSNKLAKTGFTLIELLVVVLIIGILASVALPQYNKAVFKSRFTEARQMISSIRGAVERYRMENGAEPSTFADLDLSFIDKNGTTVTAASFETKDWSYGIIGYGSPSFCSSDAQGAYVYASNPDFSLISCPDTSLICVDEAGKRCQLLGFKNEVECATSSSCYTE